MTTTFRQTSTRSGAHPRSLCPTTALSAAYGHKLGSCEGHPRSLCPTTALSAAHGHRLEGWAA